MSLKEIYDHILKDMAKVIVFIFMVSITYYLDNYIGLTISGPCLYFILLGAFLLAFAVKGYRSLKS